jgi:multimeric flavodoxin WrbA
MTKPRILCIHASERAQGNTRVLYEEAIKGAESAGADIERIYVRELQFAPCAACGACHDSDGCAVQDGMAEVYPLLRRCDRFLIASPIYFLSLPGRFKCMIDRCQGFWHRKFVLKQKVAENPSGMERLGAFLSACGHANGDMMFPPAEKVVRAFLNCLDVKLAHTLYAPGMEKPTDILRKPDLIRKAFEIGQAIARP